jgi:serine/threonine protein kinase
MTAQSSESVLAELRHLPLLTPEQRSRVEASARKAAPSPEKITTRLVDRGWLTPFQAEMLLKGKGPSLIFGHYVLMNRLGEGGMGAVFQARHTRLGRIDAVKVIRSDKITSKLIARRFLREIHLTAGLNHPHIIKALDAGQVGPQLYLATEYVRGEDLTATVRRDGPFSVADACLAAYQTALALQHIHERGFIHRDLKPSNIMREERTRTVKLLDLGLSGSLHGMPETGSYAGNLTRDGVMLGTPDFMPPEQARDPHGVDIRADLYGLGCTFFYILTGRPPFEGSAVEKLMQHASSPPPELVLPKGPTPPALAAIVARTMAKRPENRFPTPQALVDALLALRPGSSIYVQAPASEFGGETAEMPAPPPPEEWQSQFDSMLSHDPSLSGRSPIPEERPRRYRSHLPWIAAAVAAMLAIPLALFAFTRNHSGAGPIAREAAPAVEEPADELKQLRKAVLATGGNRDQLRGRVLEYRAKRPGTPQAAIAASLLRRLPSPLDRLAFATDAGVSAPVVRVGESERQVDWLAFTPADDRLLIGRRGQPLEEWDVASLKETGRFRTMESAEGAVAAATPDARTVLAIDAMGRLVVSTNNRQRLVDVGPGLPLASAAIAPDGKTAVVAFAESAEQLARINLENGKILNRLDHPSDGVESLEISPDGAACLAIGPEAMIRTFAMSSGKLLQTFDAPPGTSDEKVGCFGPDGQHLYLVGAFRTPGRFAKNSASPEASYELAPEKANPFIGRFTGQAEPTAIAISTDDAVAAVGTRTGRLYVYAAATGKPLQESSIRGIIAALAFSTNGRILAVGLTNGSVLLIKLKS